jgi:hypothetical protein
VFLVLGFFDDDVEFFFYCLHAKNARLRNRTSGKVKYLTPPSPIKMQQRFIDYTCFLESKLNKTSSLSKHFITGK